MRGVEDMGMYMKKLMVGMFLLALCPFLRAQTIEESSPTEATSADPDSLAKEYFSQTMGIEAKAMANTELYRFVYEWLGTPYRLGGNSKKGIDCSKFSLAVYENVFDTSIGYTSINQYANVKPLEKDQLLPGDLVFFKIRKKRITHVGIYLGDGKFAHASSSRGVMISNLDEAYWKRYYYSGGRPTQTNNHRRMLADAGGEDGNGNLN